MSLRIFITWELTIKELERLVEEIKKNPVISVPLSKQVELLIKRRDKK